jgi:excisionase family DNA binding protein
MKQTERNCLIDNTNRQDGDSKATRYSLKAPRRFLDKRQLAAYLGISIYTVDAWVSQRRIPYVKLGGKRVMFDTGDIDKWVDEQKVQPVELEKHLDL